MTRVAIIGGGIGGLTAANALSRAGIEAAVYEAAAELMEIGAGVALHPNAMKVLRAIGLEDDVRAVAGQAQRQVLRNYDRGFDARALDSMHIDPVLSPEGLESAMKEIAGITVDDSILAYITGIAEATRRSPDLMLGGSPHP